MFAVSGMIICRDHSYCKFDTLRLVGQNCEKCDFWVSGWFYVDSEVLETFIVPTGVCIIIMSTSVTLAGTLRCLV